MQAKGNVLPTPTTAPAGRTTVALALLSVYIIWGSTYLAIRITVQTFPPLLGMGLRFTLAGGVLYGVLRLTGTPAPERRQWGAAALVGLFLLLGGNGLVAAAEQTVSSSVTAIMMAVTPLWAALLSGLWGRWPPRLEWLGLAIGFSGVILLNVGTNLHADPTGALLVLVGSSSWAFGSVWGTRLPLPSGLMAAAAEQLVGGMVMVLVSVVLGERLPSHVTAPPLLAIGYLILFGSMLGFTSYAYLMKHTRPVVFTTYAYVNPLVAVVLGVGLAGERLTILEAAAMVIILGGVAVVLSVRQRQRPLPLHDASSVG